MNFFTCKWFVFTFEIFPDSSIGKESACSARDPSLIPGSGKSAGEGIGYPPQYSWAFLVAHLVKNPPAMWDTWVQSLGWEDPLRRERLRTPVFWLGEFHGLYSPWVVKSRTRLSNFHFPLFWLNTKERTLLKISSMSLKNGFFGGEGAKMAEE